MPSELYPSDDIKGALNEAALIVGIPEGFDAEWFANLRNELARQARQRGYKKHA